jgi:hypothetical protein
MQEGTAARVIRALASFDLKEEGRNRYRANSPLRAGSDSHAFTLVVDDDEHGAYHDHVTGEAGSLYELAAALGIDTPRAAIATLEDYAEAHHVPAAVFRAARWVEEPKTTRAGAFPALAFPTASGRRWRVLGEYAAGKPKFISEYGYKACWYGLDRAIAIARRDAAPLVLCNGEPSVIVAQHYGVAAACVTAGENKPYTPEQVSELRDKWRGALRLAFDCDDTGRAAAGRYTAQLRPLYDDLRALDLAGAAKGYDLADFCGTHGTSSAAALERLSDLTAIQRSDILPELALTPEQVERERAAIEKIRKAAWWKGYHAGLTTAAREFWIGIGATNESIEALQLGYDDEHDDLTIPYFDERGELVNVEYRQTVDPADVCYEVQIPAILRVRGGSDDYPVLLLPDSLAAIRAAQYPAAAPFPLYALPHMAPSASSLAPLDGRRVVVMVTETDERIRAIHARAKVVRLPFDFPEMMRQGMTAQQISRYIRQAG